MKKFFMLWCLLTATLGVAQHAGYEQGALYVRINHSAFDFKGLSQDQGIEKFNQLFPTFTTDFQVTEILRPFWFSKGEGLQNIFKIILSDDAAVPLCIQSMMRSTMVEYAERVPQKVFFSIPNDTAYNNTLQWHLFKIDAQDAWSYHVGSPNIKVAIIDDGVDLTHPDLAPVIWTNPFEILDGQDNDNNGFVDDINGYDFGQLDNDVTPQSPSWTHGTHVAGIAAAATNNTTGIASIGYNVTILPVKATNTNQSVTNGYESIVYAVDMGADIINLSWGSPIYSYTEQIVILYAHLVGSLVVCASGNSANSQMNYPAAYPHAMSVAATGANDVKVFNSNYGPWIDVSAPGLNIYSTIPGGGYALLSGTSMASPLVAGLAALMKSYNPQMSNQEIEQCIKDNCESIDFVNPNYFGLLGAGRINAFQAMACVHHTTNELDIEITGLPVPGNFTCTASLSPVIAVRNTGVDTVNTFQLHYSFDGAPVQSMQWSGELIYDSTIYISLAPQTFYSGNHQLLAYVSWPNGQFDWNLFNDTLSYQFQALNSGLSLPLVQDFESPVNNAIWEIRNPDQDIGWEIRNRSIDGVPNTCAWMNAFNCDNISSSDLLISPPCDFTGYDSVWVTFDYAYRWHYLRGPDSLRVLVYNGCGSTQALEVAVFPIIDSTFATSADTSETFFQAALSTQWADTLPNSNGAEHIDLSAFAGQAGIRVAFEFINRFGNNFYLDNILIGGFANQTAPGPISFDADTTQFCEGTFVEYSYTGSDPVHNWTFPGGVPSTGTQTQMTVYYPIAGTYSVTLEAGVAGNTASQTFNGFITVHPEPQTEITSVADTLIVCLEDTVILTAGGASTYQWFSPDTILSGNLFPVNAAQETAFLLVLEGTATGGCKALDSLWLQVDDCTGLNELVLQNIKAWFSDRDLIISLEKGTDEPLLLTLTDGSGKLVLTETIASGVRNLRIPAQSFSSAVYLLTITGSKGRETLKMIKF